MKLHSHKLFKPNNPRIYASSVKMTSPVYYNRVNHVFKFTRIYIFEIGNHYVAG